MCSFAHFSFFSVCQQSIGVSTMSKNSCSHTSSSSKRAYIGNKAECTADAARKGDILSSVSETLEKKPK